MASHICCPHKNCGLSTSGELLLDSKRKMMCCVLTCGRRCVIEAAFAKARIRCDGHTVRGFHFTVVTRSFRCIAYIDHSFSRYPSLHHPSSPSSLSHSLSFSLCHPLLRPCPHIRHHLWHPEKKILMSEHTVIQELHQRAYLCDLLGS
jgi:hypothetical protein